MTTPRTVTVPTLDHGDVTIPEPAWCIGHTGQRAEYRVDIGHDGPAIPIGPADQPLFVAMLTQHPFGSGDHQTGLHVEVADLTGTYSPAELDQLAAGLVEAASHLRHLARELGALLAKEGEAQ